MTTKSKARAVLIVFALLFLGIVATLAWSMRWVDQHRHAAPRPHQESSADMYAPD